MIPSGGLTPRRIALLDAVGVISLRKQDPDDVLERGEFDRRMLALALLIGNALRVSDGAKIAELRRLLRRNWVDLDEAAQAAALRQAVVVMRRLPNRVGEKIVDRAERAAMDMEIRARRRARRQLRLDIPAKLPAALGSEATRLVQPLPEFIEEEFERRGNHFLVAAIALAALLTRRGLPNAEITERLTALAESFVNRPAYALGLSATVLNRARTASLLNAFDEAGITTYEVSATLDDRTCRKCRFMHGKIFRVDRGVDLVRGVSRTASPQRIEEVNPFLAEGTDAQGRPIVYVGSGTNRRVLAREVERGGQGERGRFVSEVRESTLTTLGIGPPPYHPYCRCVPKVRSS